MREGALPPLVVMASSPKVEAQTEAARALCNLARSGATHARNYPSFAFRTATSSTPTHSLWLTD